MTELTDYLCNGLLDHFLNTSAYTQTDAHLALHTTVNSDSTPGTEESGTGYARQLTAFNAASGEAAGNVSQEEFTAGAADWGANEVSTALWDATSGGNQMCYDNDFTDTPVGNGQTLRFAATTGIIISLD